MTWRPIADEVAEDGRSLASLVPSAIRENEAAIRGDHARHCGRHYTEGLTVHPPTTEGGLGPLWFPFLLPRPAQDQEVTLRITVRSEQECTVVAWLRADTDRGRSESTELYLDTDLEVSVRVRGRRPLGRSSDWVVCAFGLTVDQEGLPTRDVGPEGLTVGVDGAVSGNVGSGPAEFSLPELGSRVYMGFTGVSTGLLWPRPPAPVDVGVMTISAVELPPVEVLGWSVDLTGSDLRRGLVHVATPQASDLRTVRDRAVAAWRDGSELASVGPFSQPGLHGRPLHEDGLAAATLVPVHGSTQAVRVAVLARAWGGARSVGYELDCDSLSGTVFEGAASGAWPADGRGVGPSTALRHAMLAGVAIWAAQDGLFDATGDLERYQLWTAEVEAASATKRDYLTALEMDFGAPLGHIAAFSAVTEVGE